MWYTGSSTRAAGNSCSEQGGPCENRGDCCSGQGLSCDGGTKTCTINGDAKDTAAAFEKELKLVEDEDLCIPYNNGGPKGGKCGCLKTGSAIPSHDNTSGTPCCAGLTCQFEQANDVRGTEAGSPSHLGSYIG